MLTIVWIDRAQALLIHFSREKMERKNFREADQALFALTSDELHQSNRILIAGPGVAKYNFQAFLREHYPMLGRRIIATETIAEPTDALLAALAQRHFERMPA